MQLALNGGNLPRGLFLDEQFNASVNLAIPLGPFLPQPHTAIKVGVQGICCQEGDGQAPKLVADFTVAGLFDPNSFKISW